MNRYLQLGASLYVPATRDELPAIANLQKYPFLRSVIFCTEDAVRPEELPVALRNIQTLLHRLDQVDLLRFVRVRSPGVLRTVLAMDGADQLSGFVFPKITRRNVAQYLDLLPRGHAFDLMLTLETTDVFDTAEMIVLRNLLVRHPCRERIVSLRIGGNDLFNLLGMRRPHRTTVYHTPLGPTISSLVTTFRPYGFNLTAPVFEYLDRPALLSREVQRDLAHGLFGKTAIHPRQVPAIEKHYRVRSSEVDMAERILDESAPAVFRSHGAMCEPATHRAWAVQVLERARLYGVVEPAKRR